MVREAGNDGVDGTQAAQNAAPAGPASAFTLHRDAWGRLVLVDAHGEEYPGVEPVRAFPISDSAHAIAICDSDGREVLYVDDPARLPDSLRQVLEAELAQREFMPIVTRIRAVSSDSAPSEWDIDTDRGPTHFILNNEDDVRRLNPNQALLIDVQGLRYFIPSISALDAHSRRTLERYL